MCDPFIVWHHSSYGCSTKCQGPYTILLLTYLVWHRSSYGCSTKSQGPCTILLLTSLSGLLLTNCLDLYWELTPPAVISMSWWWFLQSCVCFSCSLSFEGPIYDMRPQLQPSCLQYVSMTTMLDPFLVCHYTFMAVPPKVKDLMQYHYLPLYLGCPLPTF